MGKARKDAAPTPSFRSDELIGEMLERDARVADVLSSMGLPCFRCVVKDFETLAEGCAPLGLRTEEVLAKLNALS